MSQYIQFFIKKDNTFLPLFSEGRSGNVYYFFSDYAPYESVTPLTTNILSYVESNVLKHKKDTEKLITTLNEKKQLIANFNNTASEKLSALGEIEEDLRDCEEALNGCIEAEFTVRFFRTILDEAESINKYEENGTDIVPDPNEYLYFGIECGYTPEILKK